MKAEIYWDEQDPNNIGWAYRVDGGESGAIDSLDDLLQVVQNYEIDDRQMVELPTFGGDEPPSTVGIWSWDTTRMMVGEGDDINIIKR